MTKKLVSVEAKALFSSQSTTGDGRSKRFKVFKGHETFVRIKRSNRGRNISGSSIKSQRNEPVDMKTLAET